MKQISMMPYYGAKQRLAPHIIEHIPPNHRCYVELFGGSASVLLNKPPSAVEILNDLDGAVVNFYRVLRNKHSRLIRLLKATPFSRDEHGECGRSFEDRSLSDVERARHFFVATSQSYAGLVGDAFNVNVSKRSANTFKNRVDNLERVAERLRSVIIENRTAEKLIQSYDSTKTAFYADPPYVLSTRSKRARCGGKYRFEMSDNDHVSLLASLKQAKGRVLLSGHPSALYQRSICGWRVLLKARIQQVKGSSKNGRATRTEMLWTNR